MKIKENSVAGTLESSDIQIRISKNDLNQNIIYLESPVKHLYGEKIKNIIINILNQYKIENANITAIDKGALDCTIAARVHIAINKSIQNEELNWEEIDLWKN